MECLGPLLSISRSEQWLMERAPWEFVALGLLLCSNSSVWCWQGRRSRLWYHLDHLSTIVLVAGSVLVT